MINRKRFWTIGLAILTAFSIFGFSLGSFISVHATTVATNYQDPAGRFEIAVLPSYKVTPLTGLFVAESPDRELAYTVAVRPKVAGRDFNDEELAQFALELVERGEGFSVGTLTGTDLGVEVPWQGTVGRNPVTGILLARQTNNSVLVLTLSATEMGKDQLATTLTALAPSLKPL